MADRYWVGGAGTWSAANTANWSATDGGTGGASVPGAADDVFITPSSDNGSGTGYRILLSGALNTIRSISVQGESTAARPWLVVDSNLSIEFSVTAACSFQNVDLTAVALVGSTVTINFVGNRGQAVANAVPTTAPKTTFRVASGWAFSSGGTATLLAFPLPQDTLIVDDLSGSGTLFLSDNNTSGFPLGVFNALSRSLPLTVFVGGTYVYGAFLTSSAVSFATNSGDLFMEGIGVRELSVGDVFYGSIRIGVSGGTATQVNITSNFNSASTIQLLAGTLRFLNGADVTVSLIEAIGLAFKLVEFGSGVITLTGSGEVLGFSSSGTFFEPQTCSVILSDQSVNQKIFNGRGETFQSLTISNSPVASTYSFNDCDFGTLQKAQERNTAFTVSLGSNMSVGNWLVSGSSVGAVTLTGGASVKTLTYTGNFVVNSNYLNIQNINATPFGRWYAGSASQDLGGNSGWIFDSYPGGLMIAFF